RTAELLRIADAERPAAIQLFGNEPQYMAKAVRIALEQEKLPDVIDINAGCPVNKIVKQGSGSALMRSPKLLGEIVQAAVNTAESIAPSVPVTVKIRSGWDGDSVNAVEVARIAESAGAAAITVHGRTRTQMYSGKADWGVIAAVKSAVRVPVIGNGDVTSAVSCAEMYNQTGCDLVMIGRATFGRPWLFREIERYLQDGTFMPPPNLEQKLSIMREQIELAVTLKGERIALKEARKQAAWYIKGVRGAAMIRHKCSSLETLSDLYSLIEEILSESEARAE
ncbi:MAG: tRNA dihydrouridine synthase DusB, partial [Oscillospiraceae bacterium]|nr:tRNA dihydrouridine synthase DusB [Oscillospiraceae bacterium]